MDHLAKLCRGYLFKKVFGGDLSALHSWFHCFYLIVPLKREGYTHLREYRTPQTKLRDVHQSL